MSLNFVSLNSSRNDGGSVSDLPLSTASPPSASRLSRTVTAAVVSENKEKIGDRPSQISSDEEFTFSESPNTPGMSDTPKAITSVAAAASSGNTSTVTSKKLNNDDNATKGTTSTAPVKKVSSSSSTKKKKKRLSPLEQAEESILQASKTAVDLTEQKWKHQVEKYKQSQKNIKAKETQLQKLRDDLDKLQKTAVELKEQEQVSLEQKRAAVKSHRALEKKLIKIKTADAHVREVNATLEKQLKKLQSSSHKTSNEEGAKTNQKRKRSHATAGSNQKRKQKKTKQESDSEREGANTFSDDDSDWEGAVKMISACQKTERAIRHRPEWDCSACTLKNAAVEKKCTVCGTAKPGSYIDESDSDQDEEE